MLHSKKTIKYNFKDQTYGSENTLNTLPKFKIPQNEMKPQDAYTFISNELILDGNSSQNLATFVQTWSEPEIHKLMNECMVKNMIDKDEYPQTAAIEERCVHMIADLWNSPDASNTIGTSTTGSSEASMLGGLAMLWNWKNRMKSKGKPYDKPNIVTGAVQVCWEKFAKYWGIELRQIPMDKNQYTITPEKVLQYVDENTICVVPTLGLTFTLQYEPVEDIVKVLDNLYKEKGIDIPVHVDAASGGFLTPFIDDQRKIIWDFRLERVKSINASGHKFGLSPVGVGWVVWRDKSDLPEDLIFNVNYLGGNMPTFNLNFSRPGGQIVAQYYNFIRLGIDGYSKIQNSSSKIGRYIANEILKIGLFDMVYNGVGGIPGCAWKFKENIKTNFSLYDLADRLRSRGWLVPAYSLPKNTENIVVQRVLVKQNLSLDMASLLINDIKQAIKYFEKHPMSICMTESECSSFNHN